jgi:hypothetical protein
MLYEGDLPLYILDTLQNVYENDWYIVCVLPK